MMKGKALTYLRTALDDPNANFRPGQWETIQRLIENRERLMLVQRTGWGKSYVYFIATRLLRDAGSGPALLISPLLALMRNQVDAASRIGIVARTLNSSNTDDWDDITHDLASNKIDILLVSPERLANRSFMENALLPLASNIGLFIVDEAHCISDWGHDFRPDYRRIVRILRQLPKNIPVLTTTATANDRVIEDVASQLGPNLGIVKGPLARKTLGLQNIHLLNKAARLAWLADHIPEMPGSGIIYALTKHDADLVSDWLATRGINAPAYHGGKDDQLREEMESALLKNQVKALVATSALGMGFDKPDLGFVIHFQRPGSVVHYYQQVGRAGRNIEKAYGILLCGKEDAEITDYFIRTAFPPEPEIDSVLKALSSANDGLTTSELECLVNIRRGQLEKIFKFLAVEEPSPVFKDGTKWKRTVTAFTLDKQRIDKMDRLRREEQSRFDEYAAADSCLQRFLAHELNDEMDEDCGRCACCMGAPLINESCNKETLSASMTFLRMLDVDIIPRKLWFKAGLATYKFSGKISGEDSHEPGKALCHWGDPGWGEMVAHDKFTAGYFSDELVDAAAEFIKSRWSPSPFPEWVTCAPSKRNPNLVPDFAMRLASKLGLKFIQCSELVKDTKEQKEMENSIHQLKNLDGAFRVDAKLTINKPVLLIDDMVDSGWTFTVLAALLRRGGAGLVYPFALATTSKSD